MRRRWHHGWSGATATLLLAGCAHYGPQPLAGTAGSTPTLTDAATIDRPFLRPTTIDLSAPLDDNAIAIIAVIANPDLKAQRAKAGVADAQAFAARLLPDPTFSIGYAKLLSGEDPVDQFASGLGIDLNALRTRKVARAQADAAAKQVRLDLAWAEWQTAGQARIQAARIRALEASVVPLRIDDQASQLLLARNLRAAGRGDIAADAVQTARTDALGARDKLVTAEHDLAAARLELTRLLGLQPGTTIRLAPVVHADQPVDAAALTRVAVARRVDLQALQAGYASQEAALHQAVLDQFPTLALNIAGGRDTAYNYTLGPTVDFTLPLWNRNRGKIAVERATREQLRSEYDSRLFQTRAEIAAAASGIALARAQRNAIRADLPNLERIAAANRRAATRGDLSDATAEAAEGALRDKQVQLLAADQAIDEQMVALELLTGTPRENWQ